MKRPSIQHGKILSRFNGLGTVSPDMIKQRAKEIALINGREPDHFNRSDWDEAKRELEGLTDPNESVAEEENVKAQSNWAEVPAETGHRVTNGALDDEQTVAEQLVEEGVEEAEHEQMVDAEREARRDLSEL